MKPIYRCEYCDVTGTEEEIREHEENCVKNYNKKGCLTCKHCSTDGLKTVKCKKSIEIPEGKMIEKCIMYEVGDIEVIGFMGAIKDLFKQGV
jgi:hypothetical protein